MSRPLHSDRWTHGLRLSELTRELRNIYANFDDDISRPLPYPPTVTPPDEDETPSTLNWDFGTLLSPTGPDADFGTIFSPNTFVADFGGI